MHCSLDIIITLVVYLQGVLKSELEGKEKGDVFRILPTKAGKHRGEDVSSDVNTVCVCVCACCTATSMVHATLQIFPEDPVKLECLARKGQHVFFSLNALTSR